MTLPPIEQPNKSDEKQTIYAQPWSASNFQIEDQGRPKGDVKHVLKVCRGPNLSLEFPPREYFLDSNLIFYFGLETNLV